MVKEQKKSRWGLIIGVLIFLFAIAYIFAGLVSLLIGSEEIQEGNVAVIPIRGMILTEDGGDLFYSGAAVSRIIVNDIEKAASDSRIEAILLEINSPGGAPVATDEIATAVERANKTVVALIREVGASGAYWVASASDYVIANRMSITGSIGVYGSYLDFSGFINDWNISYERLVAGDRKDLGVPLRKLSEDEKKVLQKKLNLMHQVFKDEVQKNRELTNSQIENVGQGEFYLGSEALNLGLIDELGGKQEAISYIENKLNITVDLVSYERKQSFIDLLAGLLNEKNFYLGKGIGEGMQGNNVGMLR